jgi:hypothetical protein
LTTTISALTRTAPQPESVRVPLAKAILSSLGDQVVDSTQIWGPVKIVLSPVPSAPTTCTVPIWEEQVGPGRQVFDEKAMRPPSGDH